MTQRRFNKLELLKDDNYERENVDESIAVLTWGGSKGPTREAYNALSVEGQSIAWYYTMQLNPLPPTLLEELKSKELVLIPELNYLGQLSMLLRSKGVKAESITQYTGTPFKVGELAEKIKDRMTSHKKGLVQV